MIWTMRIECISGRYLESDWVRVVEMDSGSTLHSIHTLIQRTIGFDNDHLFEFYAGRNERQRAITFGTDDIWEERESAGDDPALEDIFPLPKNMKLYYHFDFGDCWIFQIRKTRKKAIEPQTKVKYPRVIEKIGSNPRQYGSY